MKRHLIIHSAVAIGIIALAASCSKSLNPYDLRCEDLTEPLGIDSASPHFSWKIRALPTDRQAVRQTAWQIQVASSLSLLKDGKADLWDSGEMMSPDQVMVPYGGRGLTSRCLAWWRVRVWDADGKASGWSKPQRFGVGVIGNDVLKGEYIGAVPGEGRCPLLRKKFTVTKTGGTAILHINSLGFHEAYINGMKVSDAVLTPAVSQLDKRSLTVTYDVTGLLKKGENEILIKAASGWYKAKDFGAVYEGPLVRAEMDIYDGDGPSPVVWTDGSWEGAWSGYTDLGNYRPWEYYGERIDARVIPEWGPVDVMDPGDIAATPQMCELCRIQETLAPVSIKESDEGRWIVDFGRIVNAMTEIALPCLPEGHLTTATYRERLTANFDRKEFGWDEYISSGAPEGDLFESRFNHHVFRYIILDGLQQAPDPASIKAHRMRTDYKVESSFRSSDEDLNKIHGMVAWTMENLAFDGFMVDCASVERLGYGGDGNASTLPLQVLADADPLYMNWMQVWSDVMREDGGLPHTAPDMGGGGGPYWCGIIVQAPWRGFMNYGDPRFLERFYPAMKHWIGYAEAYFADGLLKRWPDTDYRSWFLGDWNAPWGVPTWDKRSISLVGNCVMCQSYSAIAQIAARLGQEEDAKAFSNRLEELRTRIHETFYNPADSTYATGSQLDMTYPLLTGVVPESLRKGVRDKLVEGGALVYKGHLEAGLVGVPIITEWATLAGECDWMYGMLKQHDYPGYLFMLDKGGTGTWESWSGERSLLHNCYNGIGSWFYQALGGIIPDAPGYRHVTIAPQVPKGLEWVEVSLGTPYGKISVDRNGSELNVDLPVGVSATIFGKEYGSGHHRLDID